jgi:hypothetical protein
VEELFRTVFMPVRVVLVRRCVEEGHLPPKGGEADFSREFF